MTRYGLAVLALIGALGLTACDDEVPPEANRLDGIMGGTTTRGGIERPVVVVANAGRFVAIEFDPDGSSSTDSYYFDGAYAITNGSLSSSGTRIYGGNVNKPFFRGYSETASSVTGTATTQRWQFSVVGSAGTTTFDLVHDPLDQADSSFSRITGIWQYDDTVDLATLTIDGAGNSGVVYSSGCRSDGDVTILNPAYNVYGVATTVSDGGSGTCTPAVQGAYTGFLTYQDRAEPRADDVFVVVSKKSTPASTTHDYMAAYLFVKQ